MLTINRDDVADAIRSLIVRDDHYLEIVWAVEEFNDKFEVEPNPTLYAKLVHEETMEWAAELLENGWTDNLLKETADVLYVLEGLLAANPDDEILIEDHTLGYKLKNALNYIKSVMKTFCAAYYPEKVMLLAFKTVHRSNLSKLGDDGKPIRREDGKVLKGPHYYPANMKGLVSSKEEMLEHV